MPLTRRVAAGKPRHPSLRGHRLRSANSPLFASLLLAAGIGSALLASAASAQTAPAPLSLGFEGQAATVSGATPGGEVIFWSVFRERLARVSSRVGKLADRTAADAAGAARFDLGRDVPALSVWAAVDLASGRLALASPSGFQWTPIDATRRRIDMVLGRLAVDRHALAILIVRPGSGSWQLDVFDGGPLDEDGAYDGSLRASLAAFLPDAKSGSAPPRFAKGDVIVAVDPDDLAAFAATVGDAGSLE